LAGWFLLGAGTSKEALPDLGGGVSFDRSRIATTPLRTPLADPPTIHLNGYDRTCMECHRIVDTGEHGASARGHTPRVQHRDVVLRHGRNDRCLGCHHPTNRNRLTLLAGTEIGFSEVSRLCRECHGLVGRDWERGTHGRTMGSWVTGDPRQRRLGCTECHDPHSPAFPPIEPLPAPRTLRLPEEREPHEEVPVWPRSVYRAAKGHGE